MYVYVNRYRDGLPINKYVLSKAGAMDIDITFLHDSLSNYKNVLAIGSSDIPDIVEGQISPENESKPEEQKEGGSTNLVSVAKRAKRGVFLVSKKNTWAV